MYVNWDITVQRVQIMPMLIDVPEVSTQMSSNLPLVKHAQLAIIVMNTISIQSYAHKDIIAQLKLMNQHHAARVLLDRY